MTFIVSNLIKDVLKAHQIERYQAFVLSWRFQGVTHANVYIAASLMALV